MPGLPDTGRALLARPLRPVVLVLRADWTQRTRQALCLAAWLAAWLLCTLPPPALQATQSPSAARLVLSGGLWLLFAIASVELILAFVERDPSAARLRRALRFSPVIGLVAAIVAATLSPSIRFEESGYVATAIVAAVIVGAAATQARPDLPTVVFVLGWTLHAIGIVARVDVAPSIADDLLDVRTGALAFAVLALTIVGRVAYVERQRRLQTQRNLIEAARKYRHVYYSVPVALLSVDPAGQVQRWNDLAGQLFRAELRQGRVNTLAALLGDERAEALLAQTAAQGRYSNEVRVTTEDGAQRIVDVDALLAGDAVEISFVDVTERTQLARTLEHMAYHDPLTERLNLHGLEREIQRVSELVAQGAQASLFYVDLHRFKAVNDVFGHAAGNSLVAEVGRRIERSVPDTARIARLGGDEFLVVLPGCPLAWARTAAQNALSAIVDTAYEVDGKRIRVMASTGVVEFAPDMSAAELIAYAGAACRDARRNHGGGLVAAEPSDEHLARYRAEVDLGQRLRTSLPVERIAIFAQPIVPLRRPGAEHRSMSYEVLLRERDERGQILPPGRLIAAAERHGAMRRIDWHMLESTLRHLDGNREHAECVDFFTVNLSGISLNDERFLADAHVLLRDCPEVAPRICLEITESIAMFDVRGTRRFVEKMRSLDVRIALDDFGAGYSSFAYLRELPASLVKIDGQFMPGIDRQPRNQVIVSGIRRLAEELGMACVAEWVEDVNAIEFLLRVDMDYAQGFVLGKPEPIGHWLDRPVDLAPLEAARAQLAAVRAHLADARPAQARAARDAAPTERTPRRVDAAASPIQVGTT